MSGRVVIAGGSGFLGTSLAVALEERGYEVVVLSRREEARHVGWRVVKWDARSVGEWVRELDGAVALVNLAGRSVDCVKTPENCDEILRSRVESTRVLGLAMKELAKPPSVWVQMSTAHIYGDPLVEVCDEESAYGYGLAPTVGRAWEEAFRQAVLPTQRCVVLRTSFVLGKDRGAGSGAMDRLTWITRMGLGGTIGSGQQGISWIHEADLNALFVRAIENKGMSGAYIASSPCPVSQREFMRELRKAMGVWIGLPAPGWLVRLGAKFVLKTDPELALYGRYVVSKRLREEGFEFGVREVGDALRDVV
ncbi:epimerase [Lacunimicrobium album]